MNLIVGRQYSREEIHDLVGGGGLMSCLPTKDGRVIAGCFVPEMNKRAPAEIDIGASSSIESAAQRLVEDGNSIPVFLKRAPKAWEFVGHFKGARYFEVSLRVPPETSRHVVGTLFLEAVSE